ncbi:clathrin light chain isoform X2 [Toxorhynchites rutilus septentrionalis]|uniref:clathrin light chain isoform X2 n=1 Tax=Toxorhynchites rutilus septentrionalis TaxID=329112 RepID=UPI002478C8F1|nr:clathrin light chain isoform X2 [Toxorhynchites rutilus septentrionalis]
MDPFGDANFEQTEVDPAAEFLAREQNALAGLEDEIPLAQPAVTGNGVANGDVTQSKADPLGLEFESTGSFEMINHDADAGGLPDFAAPVQLDAADHDVLSTSPIKTKEEDENDDFSGFTVPKQVTEEPERIRKWREDQKARLEEKDREEERKKEELREQARKELEDWYKHHDETISKTKAANRNAEKQFVAETDEIEPGTEWERIAKLCDFNPKTNKSSKDISRMRSIVLQLKQNPISTAKKV